VKVKRVCQSNLTIRKTSIYYKKCYTGYVCPVVKKEPDLGAAEKSTCFMYLAPVKKSSKPQQVHFSYM
jgi:ferredoxin-thioredoxin reductase catalytic subunit